jgi:xanthine/CO dehydrogenase XdhC/CoxF family maturation factor
MRDRRLIIDQWQKGNAAALVTLIGSEGSSYRRTGARMLVSHDGSSIGSISGGCLEAEVARKARWIVRSGPVVKRFSTLFDNTAEIPFGLGCGGTLDLLFESTDTAEAAALLHALRDSLLGLRRHVITWAAEPGNSLRRTVFDESGTALFSSEGGPLGVVRFAEWLEPPQRLLLLGAGDDAQPMARFADLLGWTIRVFDGRAQLARTERFPTAELVSSRSSFETEIPRQEDAVIIMTHSYEQDRAWLTEVLPHHPRYLGLLGSRHRSSLLVTEAAAALGWTLEDACQNLFAPVGLDLGGDGAEAIALATIAEIQACCEGKLAHSRRMTPAIVSEQLDQGGSARYLQAQCAL